MTYRKMSEPFSKRLTMSLIILGVILSICNCYSSPVFNNYPNVQVYTSESYGTAVKISSDNNYVMVGYSSGNAKIYFTSGTIYTYCYGHNSPIIDIEYIPSNGWITLDSAGKAIRWSTYGSQLYTWNFTSYPTDMTVASTGGNYWVAFNFGNTVLQYNALTYSNTTTKIYTPPTYATFKKIQYPLGHSYLYASTNTSYFYQYDCYTGNYTTNYWYTYYPGTDMSRIPGGNNEVVMLNTNYIYKVRSGSTAYADMVSYSEYANLITTSYYNGEIFYILANANTSSNLYVHYASGVLKQTITYNTYTIKAIDASTMYLCTIDNYGYLSIYSYSPYDPDYISSDFPVWAIVLMTTLFFFLCVVGLVLMVVKARKRRQAQMINNYNRFNNQSNNPAFIPNNNQPFNAPVGQHFNQPSGQQYSGNNFNPQPPTWNSNPQPYFNNYNPPVQPVQPPVVQPASQQNPYQANQPSNWS